MSNRTRTLLMCGAAALTLALAPANRDPVQASGGFEVALSGARVDMLDNDRIVASFDATGDIRGLLTATIDRDANGALKGEWVLVSRYLRDLTPEGQVDDLAVDSRAALPGCGAARPAQGVLRRSASAERCAARSPAARSPSTSTGGSGRSNRCSSRSTAATSSSRASTGAGSLTGSNLQTTSGIGTLSLAPQAVSTAGGEVMTTLRLRYAFAGLLAVCLLALGATDAQATHFRYGTMRWEVIPTVPPDSPVRRVSRSPPSRPGGAASPGLVAPPRPSASP